MCWSYFNFWKLKFINDGMLKYNVRLIILKSVPEMVKTIKTAIKVVQIPAMEAVKSLLSDGNLKHFDGCCGIYSHAPISFCVR